MDAAISKISGGKVKSKWSEVPRSSSFGLEFGPAVNLVPDSVQRQSPLELAGDVLVSLVPVDQSLIEDLDVRGHRPWPKNMVDNAIVHHVPYDMGSEAQIHAMKNIDHDRF